MSIYLRSFWVSFLIAMVVVLLPLHLWWSSQVASMPARPSFPFAGGNYVSESDNGICQVAHYLYRFGMFGLEEKLQHCDVLLLGTSHVEFGLSAKELSAKLTTSEGRPIRAYNLGVGCDDSFAFNRGILSANQISNKPVIVDLFTKDPDIVSNYAQTVEKSNELSAYLLVDQFWLNLTIDWMLDPLLPCFIHDSGFKGRRPLKAFLSRSWETGDIVGLWTPGGEIYAGPGHEQPLPAINPAWKGRCVSYTPLSQTIVKINNLHPVFTMVPFCNPMQEEIPSVAQPYISISPEELTTVDAQHLNGKSRDIATDRLFDSMKNQGLIAPWLDSARTH